MVGEKADASKARLEAVDLARLAAAAAVVWIHVTDCDESQAFLPLCRFAVPFFTCAAVYFVLHKVASEPATLGSYFVQRMRQLYLPFLLWSGIYLGARYLKHALAGPGSPIVLSPAMLLNGTAHHLWFLPFICLVSIATFGLAKVFRTSGEKHPHWCALASLSFGTALALAPCPVVLQSEAFPLSYFIDHAWDILPAAFFGATIFGVLRSLTPTALLRALVLMLGLILLGWDFVDEGHSIRSHVAGASILFFTITQPNRKWMSSFWPWAKLAFVIYLVHVLFVETLQTTAARFGGVQSLSADLSVWALSLVVSALTANAMVRFRPLSWTSPR